MPLIWHCVSVSDGQAVFFSTNLPSYSAVFQQAVNSFIRTSTSLAQPQPVWTILEIYGWSLVSCRSNQKHFLLKLQSSAQATKVFFLDSFISQHKTYHSMLILLGMNTIEKGVLENNILTLNTTYMQLHPALDTQLVPKGVRNAVKYLILYSYHLN